MQLQYKDIVLREFKEEDIESIIKFNTEQNEYLDWYKPWEKEEFLDDFDPEIYALKTKKDLEKGKINTGDRFIIEHDEKVIGQVDSYFIDYEYNLTKEKEESTDNKTINAIIYDSSLWDDSYVEKALIPFIKYLFYEREYKIIYAQTWSGNKRYERELKNLGFRVVSRLKDTIKVNDQTYDYITLKLIPANFNKFKKIFEENN